VIDVVLAAPDVAQEPDLVVAASGCGVRVLRRCVDAVDLLAAAAIDPDVTVVLSAGLPRLSSDAVRGLGTERRIVGLAADPLDATSLSGRGIRLVVPVEPTAASTWSAVRSALSGAAPPARPEPGAGADAAGVWTTGVWDPGDPSVVAAPDHHPGRLVAVWGPPGAPGRTTVAIGLAEALAESGRRVCLVDADTYAPSVAAALGLVDDPGGGLARACRQADTGLLDAPALASSARRVRGEWHVLTGLTRADRWGDLAASALDTVWQCAQAAFDVAVVDVGFCLEDDDAPAAWARRRNAAAVTAVASADRLVAVADASSAGAARLVAAWPGLAGAAGATRTTVVRNRSGRRSAGSGWDDALREFGIGAAVRPLPADARTLDSCWSRGRSLGESARRSPLRRALVRLAEEVVSG